MEMPKMCPNRITCWFIDRLPSLAGSPRVIVRFEHRPTTHILCQSCQFVADPNGQHRPCHAVREQVDADEQAEHPQAGRGPLHADGNAQYDGDEAVEQNPSPGGKLFDQGHGDAAHPPDQEACREHKRQPLRGKQRVLKCQESDDRIKDPQQQKEEEAAPVACQTPRPPGRPRQ